MNTTQIPFRTVSIDGFRGLRNLKLQDLGLLNILVGANNSGKTSVLEALTILSNPLEPLEWLAMVRRRDFGGLDETRIQSLRWCFRQSGSLTDPDTMFEAECRMTNEGAYPLRALAVTYRDIIGEPDPDEVRRSVSRKRPRKQLELDEMLGPVEERGAEIWHRVEADPLLFRGPKGLSDEQIVRRIWEQSFYHGSRPRYRHGSVKCETLTPYSYQINRVQVSSHSKHLFDHRNELVLDLVRDFDPEIETVALASFRGERPAIYVEHKRLGPAPLSVFGDAFRRAVLLASTLPTLENGGLLLIDEVETGIHVSALRRVFEWLKKWSSRLRVQVVATTHSLEALDAIALSETADSEEVVTFHLEQTKHETRAKRIDEELLLRLRRERGLDVR